MQQKRNFVGQTKRRRIDRKIDRMEQDARDVNNKPLKAAMLGNETYCGTCHVHGETAFSTRRGKCIKCYEENKSVPRKEVEELKRQVAELQARLGILPDQPTAA